MLLLIVYSEVAGIRRVFPVLRHFNLTRKNGCNQALCLAWAASANCRNKRQNFVT
jgi:hypothetical protein